MRFCITNTLILSLSLTTPGLAQVTPRSVGGAAGGAEIVDFEGVPAGTILSGVFGNLGSGPIMVSGYNPDLGNTNAAVVFNSAAPTGDDFDLGTPNETFGGPGIGEAGEMGSPFENALPQGHCLIVAENLVDGNGDGLVDDPDDADTAGSFLAFDFSMVGDVGTITVNEIYLIDVEAEEPFATVDFFDVGGNLITSVNLPATGDNGVIRWDFGGISGVQSMLVSLNGSGAIDDIIFTPDQCTGVIGDFVWKDSNCDGLQNSDETGITGVTVWLTDNEGNLLDTSVTNSKGAYSFEGLCEGRYIIEVDTSTLPPNCVPAPCNVGRDDTKDNDCSPVIVDLPTNDSSDLTIDFGYCNETGGGEGCTPGYWKQPHHFDSWPSGLSPGMFFSDVFEDAFPGMTLLEVLSQGGGGLKALGRHTVAALLNAASDGVDYGMDGNMVVELFNDVYPGGVSDYQQLKNFFEALNESGCPLN